MERGEHLCEVGWGSDEYYTVYEVERGEHLCEAGWGSDEYYTVHEVERVSTYVRQDGAVMSTTLYMRWRGGSTYVR